MSIPCWATRSSAGPGRALLDPLGGAVVLSELNRLMEQQRRHDKRDATGAHRPRVDALVEMATRSRTALPGGLRPRPLITILTGHESFARICELADGTVLLPRQLVPLLSEADIERVVFDGPDRVLSVSRGAPSPGRCAGPSKCVTGTASTPPDATNQPTAATSTTSSPTPTAAQPPSTTGGSAAGPTTATTTSATPHHNPSPMRMPAKRGPP